jgi:hypothetical protein
VIAKLLALAVTLAALIPAQVTVAGVTVHHLPALVAIVLLTVAALALRAALRTVARYPSSPYFRRGTAWRCA